MAVEPEAERLDLDPEEEEGGPVKSFLEHLEDLRWVLIKSTWMSWLQHRAFFFLLAFGWMIPPLISLFVWFTAASGRPGATDSSRGPSNAAPHTRIAGCLSRAP